MPLSRPKINRPGSARLPLLSRSDPEHDNQRILMNSMISKPLSLGQSQQDHPIRILVRTKNALRAADRGKQQPAAHRPVGDIAEVMLMDTRRGR
jgi:hypothetical protein